MNLFQQFAPLVAAGVTIQMKLSANGEKLQLDLIPVAKENKAGITLTPKALVASAAELDEQLPAFLETYLASQLTISGLIEQSQAELKAAEDAAKSLAQEAKAAVANKSTPKAPGKSTTRPSVPGKKPRDLTDGLMDGGDTQEIDESGDPAGEEGSDAQPAGTGALDESLF
jgi:PRTRC genetic system protein E